MDCLGFWSVLDAMGSIFGAIAAGAAIYVALYVNHDAKLPEIVAHIEHDRDHSCANLIVQNCGSGVARDIHIVGFDYEMVMDSFKSQVQASFIEHGIPVLVPKAKRSTALIAGWGSLGSYKNKKCVISIEYVARKFPFGTKVYKDTFVLEYLSLSGSLYTPSDMHRLTKAVEKLAK